MTIHAKLCCCYTLWPKISTRSRELFVPSHPTEWWQEVPSKRKNTQNRLDVPHPGAFWVCSMRLWWSLTHRYTISLPWRVWKIRPRPGKQQFISRRRKLSLCHINWHESQFSAAHLSVNCSGKISQMFQKRTRFSSRYWFNGSHFRENWKCFTIMPIFLKMDFMNIML